MSLPRPASPRPAPPATSDPSPPSSSGLRIKEAGQRAATFFLGRYRVVEELGAGGMATVHLARMDGPGGFQKWVAVKRIHPHLAENEQRVDMFLDEARTAAGINHANVAQVFDLGRDDDGYWIVMEYLHGEALREVQARADARGVRIGPEIAARIVADAALGLHAAHELCGKNGQLLGLVHRDVSPHNLFVTYDGQVKVVDFGIAKADGRLSGDTLAGTLKGKIAYMSPEQLWGGTVDRTTDVFALGVVLWELTTGRRLFRVGCDIETMEKVRACVVPPPSTLVPGYPPALEACVMKALAKHREDRFPTARALSRALQEYLVRSGSFAGSEEVADLLRALFGDRIQQREAHLAWAAEVTSAGDVGCPRDTREPASSGWRRAQSDPVLLDDDDDVPTTVATREMIAQHVALAPPAASPPVDLGATVALPMGAGRGPSPAFEQHLRAAAIARPAPLPLPPVAPTPPPAAFVPPPPAAMVIPPAPSAVARHADRRTVVLAALVLLAVLGLLALVAVLLWRALPV